MVLWCISSCFAVYTLCTGTSMILFMYFFVKNPLLYIFLYPLLCQCLPSKHCVPIGIVLSRVTLQSFYVALACGTVLFLLCYCVKSALNVLKEAVIIWISHTYIGREILISYAGGLDVCWRVLVCSDFSARA